jgi:hypothetical protein
MLTAWGTGFAMGQEALPCVYVAKTWVGEHKALRHVGLSCHTKRLKNIWTFKFNISVI